MTLKTGTILNNIYRVVNLLGKGAMGNVYLVERIKDDKKIVVKELIFSNETGIDCETGREIFFREAEFMAKFSHSGLPKMHGIFSQDGKDYLTMDYIEGKTLEEIINSSKEPLDEENAIKWTIELADIMDYLHNSFHQPIIYRDLKPSNIIITSKNEAKLVDFGIARYYNPDKNTDTFRYGSPGYAAPEQYKGRGQSGPQSDIFGLGVILYEMMTKYDPTIKPLVFPSIKSLNPSISTRLEGIIIKAINLVPMKRYISMSEFKEELQRYSGFHKIYEANNKIIPNKWATRGKHCAFATILIPMITWTIIVISGPIFHGHKYDFLEKILFTIVVLSFAATFLSPFTGLIFGIIGAVNSRRNPSISIIPVKEAIGCNSAIIIFALLIAIVLVPNFYKARQGGYTAACESNLRNIGTALEMYAVDNKQLYPVNLNKIEGNKYIKKLPVCPYASYKNDKEKETYGYNVSQDFKNFTIWCSSKEGSHARGYISDKGQWPQYTSSEGLILK